MRSATHGSRPATYPLQASQLTEMLPALVVASLLSAAVNLTCYWAVRTSSATTFKVAGCLKNVVVVAAGILDGDEISARELQSYAVSMAGFVAYTWLKQRSG